LCRQDERGNALALGGLENIGRAPELRKRIFFVLIMLAVYRIGVHIPTPGVDSAALAELFRSFQGTLLGLFDMFSGQALSRFSVFALGIMPRAKTEKRERAWPENISKRPSRVP
jgi:preprotein translocase subunit SecY